MTTTTLLKTIGIAALQLGFVLDASFRLRIGDITGLHRAEGSIAGVLAAITILWMCGRIAKKVSATVLVVALLCGSWQTANAQLVDDRLPAYNFDYATSTGIMMADVNGERLGLLGGAVCVVAGAAIIYVGWRAVNACLDLWEHKLTNNPAPGVGGGGGEQTPTVPDPDPVPMDNNTVPGSQHGCPCTAGAPPPAGQPLPLLVEHSYDQEYWEEWTTVTRGVVMGETYVMPNTGFWRITVLPLRISRFDGGAIVHAPPGVLQFSRNLKDWETISINTSDVDLPAQEGFYRIAFNTNTAAAL